MGGETKITGPDFTKGVATELFNSTDRVVGHVDSQPALLIYKNNKYYAIGALCSHYSANLADGLIDGNEVRCPYHHACFDLNTGRALKAPAMNPIPAWSTEEKDGKIFVKELKVKEQKPAGIMSQQHFIIIGSGAAGHYAAETLRNEGFAGKLSLYTADSDLPYDRPNLSKDYLAGNAPEEWMSLRSSEFYKEKEIEIVLSRKIKKINGADKRLIMEDESEVSYDKCLIATGVTPRKLNLKGAELPHVFYLKSFSDCKKIINGLEGKKNVVIIGSGFIGLEAAAALTQRKLSVTVVGKEALPFTALFGADVAKLVSDLHLKNGVAFENRQSVSEIKPGSVVLDNKKELPADAVIVAIGSEANTFPLDNSGAVGKDGIVVNEFLQTTILDVYAAGDIARWPYPFAEFSTRVEHWVVAQRLGHTAALNMLGKPTKFREIPFFWTAQYDLTLSYTGHSKKWDSIKLYGSLPQRRFAVSYLENNKICAVLTSGLDKENLEIEKAFEENAPEKISVLLEKI